MTTTLENAELTAVLARLDAIDARLATIVARQQKTDELVAEMTPILREVMATATTRLDALEKKGWFAFGRELLGVAERVVQGFEPREVRELGDSVVSILRTVRAVTQPRVLEVAAEASEVIERSDQAEPLGLLGMVRATGDADVQKGMSVMMEIMRQVGRAAKVVSDQRRALDPAAVRREKLAAALGPRRRRADTTPAPATPETPATPTPASTCAVPDKGPRAVAAVVDGIAFSADGHLADAKQWTDEVAAKLASALDVSLDDARWAVVRFARADFEATGVSPNIRRITQGTGLATKDVYALFPRAPARTIAKIAGIPKPAGCL